MDRLSEILRAQSRAYWRRASRATNLAIGHQGITLILAILVLLKYLGFVMSAATRVAQGDVRVVQSLFAVVFLAWLFLPLSSRAENSLNRFLHLPLSIPDLLLIRITSLLITPFAWIVIAASFAIFYPLAYAPSPGVAITVGFLFITFSCLAGLVVAHLLSAAMFRRFLFVVLLLVIVPLYLVHDYFALTQTLTRGFDTAISLGLANKRRLLLGLIVLNVCAFNVALWSLPLTFVNENRRRARRGLSSVLFSLRGAIGSLAAKDVRYFQTLLDPYLGILASTLGCIYLVGAEAPTLPVVLIFIVIVFIPNCPLAFNSFGLDTRDAWERYAVLPVSGATIIHAKNLAFMIIVGVQLAPIVVLASWRMGPTAGVVTVLATGSMALVYLTLGNWMSISLPAKMYRYRFAPATGSLPEIIAGLFLGSLPGLLVIYVVRSTTLPIIWSTLFLFIVVAAGYLVVTAWSGRRFGRRRERIALAVALR